MSCEWERQTLELLILGHNYSYQGGVRGAVMI